ncbi:hypothetical protein NIBR502774_18035 (plasmid) [Rhizobium sp. NIBRBAC000502774]|nr:hypothetical protein NIBR502774_18035 [Rhizobium sp. NIBRBAC000502774]
MDDLETTIVINPAIPLTDMTKLERLVLSKVFDAGEIDNALLLHTNRGATLTFSLAAGDLSAAYETSRRAPKSDLNCIVAECWRDQIDGRDHIEIDLRPRSWEFILHDIVARSVTLMELRVLEWSRHPSQRSDSFGASIMLITATECVGRSSDDFFEEMRAATEAQRPAEGLRNPPGVPDLSGAEPVLERMRNTIDRQMTGRFPRDQFMLDTGGRNSLTTIRRFIESFATPAPAIADSQSRQLDAALCCWEAMQDYRILFEHDKPLVRNIHVLMQLWTQLGSIELRRWARPAAIYALELHDHLGQELIDRLVPFDYGFIPAVLEVLEWTENGPDFATTREDAAARVLKKLQLEQGASR